MGLEKNGLAKTSADNDCRILRPLTPFGALIYISPLPTRGGSYCAFPGKEDLMAVKSFEPKFMKMSVLTAALQELTPRAVRDPDPDKAIEDWLQFTRELEIENIQLSAALHPSESDVPAEAMLDPVANTLDLRKPFDSKRANRVLAAMKETRIGITDVSYFD